MAKYADHDLEAIYGMAGLFRKNCLLDDGSLLFDNASIWRLDSLERIRREFIEAADEGDRSFLEKFKDQIGTLGEDVVKLCAELLYMYFLFPSNVTGGRKREVISEVLSWANVKLPDDNLPFAALSEGVGSGGQGYNTRRPFEIAFLIKLAIAWKNLPLADQTRLATSPWSFRGFVDGIEDAESRQLRHMLLYLLFPESFERIASGSHKRRIIKAFGNLLPERREDDSEDYLILCIRRELEKLLPGKQLDFYWTPLREAWYDDSDADSEKSMSLELIQHKKQVVLYGPPGTGKTYTATKLAERIIRSAALTQWGAARYFQSERDITDAIKSNIVRLQLHPAYSYEDFIRGLHISEGRTEYRFGHLPRLIQEMEKQRRDDRLPHVLILDEMNRTDLSRMLGECFSLLENRDESVTLPAHDVNGQAFKLRIPDDLFVIGTMNLIDQSIEQVDFALRRRFLWLECPYDPTAFLSAAKAKWTETKSKVEWTRVESDFQKLASVASKLNEQIKASELLGPQYEIGHTYLLDVVAFLHNYLGLHATRKQNYLWNKRGEAIEPVIQVWKLSLFPLLEQYLAGHDSQQRGKELEDLSRAFLKPEVSE